MNNDILNFITISLLLASCTADQFNASTYKVLSDRECLETHGYPDCRTGEPDYETYKKQREDVSN